MIFTSLSNIQTGWIYSLESAQLLKCSSGQISLFAFGFHPYFVCCCILSLERTYFYWHRNVEKAVASSPVEVLCCLFFVPWGINLRRRAQQMDYGISGQTTLALMKVKMLLVQCFVRGVRHTILFVINCRVMLQEVNVHNVQGEKLIFLWKQHGHLLDRNQCFLSIHLLV